VGEHEVEIETYFRVLEANLLFSKLYSFILFHKLKKIAKKLCKFQIKSEVIVLKEY